MQFTHLLGIDISKKTIDVALSLNQSQASVLSHQFSNNPGGYKKMLIWLRKEGIAFDRLLVCMENTGIYHRPLVAFLQRNQAFVWVEHPVTIKWSMGLQRGKTDKIDAQRICLYAFRNQDKAKAYNARDKSLQRVSELLATRERLMKAENMLLAPIKELKALGLTEEENLVKKACKQSLSTLKKEIKEINKALEASVKENPGIAASYKYIRSVAHVGGITALHLLVYTHDFDRFSSAKKLASYAGVAPFAYQSGSSVRGRTKVHSMANKSLKKALHMCAVSSIRWAGEMRSYFDSKVKEGKNKMSIINAIIR